MQLSNLIIELSVINCIYYILVYLHIPVGSCMEHVMFFMGWNTDLKLLASFLTPLPVYINSGRFMAATCTHCPSSVLIPRSSIYSIWFCKLHACAAQPDYKQGKKTKEKKFLTCPSVFVRMEPCDGLVSIPGVFLHSARCFRDGLCIRPNPD